MIEYSEKEWRLRENIIKRMLNVPNNELAVNYKEVNEYDHEIHFELGGGLSAKLLHKHHTYHNWIGNLTICLDGRVICEFENENTLVEKVFRKYYLYIEDKRKKMIEEKAKRDKLQKEEDLTEIERILTGYRRQ